MRTLPPLVTRDRALGAVLITGCGILQALALAFVAFATRDAFGALHVGEPLSLRTGAELTAAGLLAAFCVFFSGCQAEALGQSYAIALRRAFYAKIARLPKSRHEKRRVGALSLRFVGDLSAARLWFGRGLPDVLTALVVLPGAVAILWSLDQTLALAGLTPLGLTLVLMTVFAWRLESLHRRLRGRRASIAIKMIERIAIAPELDLMGRTGKELRILDAHGASLKSDAVGRRARTIALQAILQGGVALAGLTVLWSAGRFGTPPATAAAGLSVLALIALPLHKLAVAWDHHCAWRVARGKAIRLLNEPEMVRRRKAQQTGVSVSVTGIHEGQPVDFSAEAGLVTTIGLPGRAALARLIAGLDRDAGISVSFGTHTAAPCIAYIGDTHIGLQGSLRKSATLSARKRPDDARIRKVLYAFGLQALVTPDAGLETRLAENGKGLTAPQTLRLDLTRAVLGRACVIVIASVRFDCEPLKEQMLTSLRELSNATIIVADSNRSANATTQPEAI